MTAVISPLPRTSIRQLVFLLHCCIISFVAFQSSCTFDCYISGFALQIHHVHSCPFCTSSPSIDKPNPERPETAHVHQRHHLCGWCCRLRSLNPPPRIRSGPPKPHLPRLPIHQPLVRHHRLRTHPRPSHRPQHPASPRPRVPTPQPHRLRPNRALLLLQHRHQQNRQHPNHHPARKRNVCLLLHPRRQILLYQEPQSLGLSCATSKGQIQ